MRVLLCVLLIDFVKNGEGTKHDDYDEYIKISQRAGELLSHFDIPVPFGHITGEGFGDAYSPMKQPIDKLEIRLRPKPKNKKEALELLEKSDKSNIIFLNPNIGTSFSRANPKEEMLMEKSLDLPSETNHTMLKWYDLANMQARNAMMGPKSQHTPNKKAEPVSTSRPSLPQSSLNNPRASFFSENSFQLKGEAEESVNWTTCDEFAVGALFSPKDIVNLKWTPFYIWGTMPIYASIEHTFEYPTKKLVNEYYLKYNKMLGKAVDWTKPKLLMTGINEALLIAADKRGLFDVITKHEIPEYIPTDARLPSLSLRMKIEDPYLFLAHCENRFAMLMALSGNEPTDAKEMRDEAATVKFIGPGEPVWRNYQAEKEKITMEKEAKIRAENDKFIIINEPRPPVGQWD